MNYVPYDPTKPLPPGRPPEGWCPQSGDRDQLRHNLDWLRLVDAGLIGQIPPAIPRPILANIEANEAILRRNFPQKR